MGGTVQKGSGSSEFAKGDFRSVGNIRGECKLTKKEFYTLKEEELQKIKLEALKGGFEDWVMQVEYVGAGGQSKKFAVLDYRMFMEMWAASPLVESGPLLTQSAHWQPGKSFRMQYSEMMGAGKLGLHIHQVTFGYNQADIPRDTMKKGLYAIVPWQTYLSTRTAFLAKGEAE